MDAPELWSILEAVVQLLEADPTLITLLGTKAPGEARVLNHIPQDFDFPYIRVRLDSIDEFDTKGSEGYRHDIVCDCWVDQHGDLERGLHQPLVIIPADLNDERRVGHVRSLFG